MQPCAARLGADRARGRGRRRRRRARSRFRCRPGGRSSVISPVSDLPAAPRASRGSMPWSSALRSRCSSGPTELLQHRAVELDLRAADLEVGALVELLRRLPRGSGTAARTGCRTAPCGSRTAAAARRATAAPARAAPRRRRRGSCSSDCCTVDDVVDALGERARQLLEARVAVELQRIEALAVLATCEQSATGSATRPGSRSRAPARAGGSRCS